MRIAHSIAALVMFAVPTVSGANGIPSWRINPFSVPALAEQPALRDAVSVSLMITLSGGSLFNWAGLDLAALTDRGATIYNHPAGGNLPISPVLTPDLFALDYDTYVTGPDRFGSTTIAGRYNGVGPAQLGPGAFNVSWGATPNNGSPGTLEFARVTMFGVEPIGSTPVSGVTVVSDKPHALVAVPPIPVRIPEPASVLVVAAIAMFGRRRTL